MRFIFAMFILLMGPNDARPPEDHMRLNFKLSQYAQTYADELCDKGILEHASSARLVAETHNDWVRIGENIGRGPIRRPRALLRAFKNSPSHYNNMTDPTYDIFGFGACRRDGMIYVVYRFEDRRSK